MQTKTKVQQKHILLIFLFYFKSYKNKTKDELFRVALS